jgi:PPOX class probable F420-dependent enzyme
VIYTEHDKAFLSDHVWAVLGTARKNGSPQQSMVGYTLDADGRLLISTRRDSAKWHNVARTGAVSLAVPDGRMHLTVYGSAETIESDPERAELSADVLAVVRGPDRPDPSTIVGWLDQDNRGVLRVTPEKVLFHD